MDILGFTVPQILQILAVLLSALGIIRAIRSVRKQLFLQTFLSFTQRYSEIMDSMPDYVRNPDAGVRLESLGREDRTQILNALRQYLNMCSEELFLAQNGCIDQPTWEIWQRGIRDMLTYGYVRQAWSELEEEYKLYPEFQSLIRDLLSTVPAVDLAEAEKPASGAESAVSA